MRSPGSTVPAPGPYNNSHTLTPLPSTSISNAEHTNTCSYSSDESSRALWHGRASRAAHQGHSCKPLQGRGICDRRLCSGVCYGSSAIRDTQRTLSFNSQTRHTRAHAHPSSAQGASWLLSVPGASATMLEVAVPYSRNSLVELLGEVSSAADVVSA